MYFLRVIGVVLVAAVLAGCTLSEKQFHDLRIVLKQRPDLRVKLEADCARNVRTLPRDTLAVAAEVVDLKPATFPQVFCRRMVGAYVRGQLTYADYKATMRKKSTPRLIRIIRGKRP